MKTHIGYSLAAAAAFIVGLLSHSSSQAQAGGQQRFSYEIIYENSADDTRRLLLNAGAKGWELVAVVPPSEKVPVRYILKHSD